MVCNLSTVWQNLTQLFFLISLSLVTGLNPRTDQVYLFLPLVKACSLPLPQVMLCCSQTGCS